MIGAMQELKRALPWLVLALAAIVAGYWDIDLRLLAGALCGVAVMASAGAPGKRRSFRR